MKPFAFRLRILLIVTVIAAGALHLKSQPVKAQPAENPQTILLVPFRLHASEDLPHLTRGILEMLGTRLPRPGLIRVKMERKIPADDPAALKMALDHGADFILVGGVTIFGQNVSTDARLLESATGRPRLMFSRSGGSQGDVLQHIESLASEIIDAATPPKAAEAPASIQAAPLPALQAMAQPPLPEKVAPVPTGKVWRSEPIKFQVVSLSAGDIDGDGRTEIVAAGTNTIRVFRLSGGSLQSVFRWDTPDYETHICVDAADFNQNGLAEIYVTHLGQDKRLQSFVLEWRNHGLKSISENNAWFFRVLHTPGLPARLIGQKQQMLGSRDSFDVTEPRWFLPGVFDLTWKDGAWIPAAKLRIPDGIDVTDFSFGDVLHTGSPQTIAFTGKGQLAVFNSDGQRQWSGKDSYGGREEYLEIPANIGKSQSGRHYLPQRIWAMDSNSDGRKEIIVVRNSDSGRRLMERFRNFNQGRVVCLSWTGAAFRQLWETDIFNGYISDLILVNIDLEDPSAKGRPSLIMALVEKETGLFKDRVTRLVIQPFPVPK